MRTMNSDGSNNQAAGIRIVWNSKHGGARHLPLVPLPSAHCRLLLSRWDTGIRTIRTPAPTSTLPLKNNSTTRVQLTNDIEAAGEAMVHSLGSRRSADFVQGSALVWRRRRSGRNLHRVSRLRRQREHHRIGRAADHAGNSIRSCGDGAGRPVACFRGLQLVSGGRPGGLLRGRDSRPVDRRTARQPAPENLHRLRDVATVVSGRDENRVHDLHPGHSDDQVERIKIHADHLADINLVGLLSTLVSHG